MGRGTKIFLPAVLVSLCLFGLVAFAIISAISDSAEQPAVPNAESFSEGAVTGKYMSLAGSSFNVLFGAENDGRLIAQTLVRFDKERAQITLTPIPLKTVVSVNGEKLLLSSLYDSSGIDGVSDAVEMLTGISVDYRLTLNGDSLVTAADSIGPVDYTVSPPVNVGGTEIGGARRLDGEAILAVLVGIGADRADGADIASDILAALLSKYLLLENRSAVFNTVLGCAKTDFTADFFTENAELIYKLYEFRVTTLPLVGSRGGNGIFTPDVAATLDAFSNYRKYYA